MTNSYVEPLSTIHVMISHASDANSKCKVELVSYADTCVVGENCIVIHDHNWLVHVYSYNPKDGHRSAKTVNAKIGYQDLQSG